MSLRLAMNAASRTLREAAADTRLRGRWLLASRVGWLIVAILSVGFFVAGAPVQFARLAQVCPTSRCASGQLQPEAVQALRRLGLSLAFFATYAMTLIVLFAMVYAGVAALIFWRRSDDRMALFASLALLTFGLVTFPGVANALAEARPEWSAPIACLNLLGAVMFTFFLFLFPDGHFTPRWTAWLALIWCASQIPSTFFPSSTIVASSATMAIIIVIWICALGVVVYAQFYRYRRESSATQRRQTKWVVYGIAAAVVGLLVGVATLDIVYPRPASPSAMATTLAVDALVYGGLMLVPLSIGIAILRARLFDVDLLISRTLVYGALTLCVVGVYIVVVGSLGALFQARGNLVIALLGAGLVAVLFHPLREWLQRGVNHLIYGQRDEPYAVISRLSQRLEVTLAFDAVLPAVVEAVAVALKLPYVAISLREADMLSLAASFGEPQSETLRLPLVYQAESLGEMLVSPRAPGEAWTPSDRRLLNELARQAGAAAHAVRLTAELQQSNDRLVAARERLVTTREEERRRLRRDLHDGLGPALAAMTLKVGAARRLLPRNQSAADTLLAELGDDIHATVGDIRRLVYNLRPPTLDELGLVGAIRERAAQSMTYGEDETRTEPQIIVVAPGRLPTLPAAVEVAAFRITQEALTNAMRHAHARTCTVRLALDDGLRLEITDDGVGLPAERPAGVGLTAMRERAAELGGECEIGPAAAKGVRVSVWLPIAKGG